MSKGVFTRMKRVEFVEKTSSEVGDGTAFPMEVTLDQLAEIMYRVKDSVFSGSVTEDYTGIINTYGFSGAPTSELVSEATTGVWEWFVRRGYSTGDVSGFAGYFGSSYPVNGDNWFDIEDNERGVWAPNVSGVSDFRTGYSHLFSSNFETEEIDPSPSHYLAYNTLDGYFSPSIATLVFSREVAWVDVNLSGNPFDPANQLYLGLSFDMQGVFYTTTYISSNSATAGNASPTGLSLEIELSGGVVLDCPIYFSSYDAIATYSGSIRCIATEWWPYAKGSPAEPVWDSETGVKF